MNSADEAPLDEEAERKAFSEAVMEWRRMGKGSMSATAGSTEEGSDSKPDSSMWSNPFSSSVNDSSSLLTTKQSAGKSLADGELDEAKERAVNSTNFIS